MRVPSPVLLSLAACATLRGGGSPQTDFEVRQTLDRFVTVSSYRTLGELLDLLTVDVYAFDQGADGEPVRLEGKEAVRRYLEQTAAHVEAYTATLSDVQTRAAGDAAWVAATWTQTITANGQETTWRQLGTFYLRRDPTSGKWKIAGWHASHAESTAPAASPGATPDVPAGGARPALP